MTKKKKNPTGGQIPEPKSDKETHKPIKHIQDRMQVITCILCNGSGMRGNRTCTLCDGTKKIRVMQ